MNADNTYVVKIHNEHDKMRFLDTFPRLLFVKTNKMDHKLRETWKIGTLVTTRWSLIVKRLGPTWPMHVANRWEQWADRSPVSLDSCLPRPRSRRLGGSRGGRWTWRVGRLGRWWLMIDKGMRKKRLASCTLSTTFSDRWQTCQHGIRSRRRAVTD